MPSSRQLRVIGFIAILAVLVIYYVSNGAQSTHNSPFYKSTVAAIQDRKDAEARKTVIEEEQARQERVELLRKEHDIAMAKVMAADAAATPAAGNTPEQQPFVPPPPPQQSSPQRYDGGSSNNNNNDDDAYGMEKSVAGRKKMKDDKVVHGRPGNDAADGVAKVGNVKPKATENPRKPATESQENAAVEAELDSILKRGPIIVFSKSYCPYSKKAKHILLDLYTINPRPYVVELDTHAFGPELQDALQRLTGRRTVPNVLINGRSIGGGDDVEALHRAGTLAETVQAMGSKRIYSVQPVPEPGSEADPGREKAQLRRFRA